MFPALLDDASTYEQAQAYWAEQLDTILATKAYEWSPFYQNDAQDGNPLFSVYVPAVHKLVRITTFAPEPDDVLFSAYLEQWAGDFPAGIKPASPVPIPELVIDLAMTESTVQEARQLIFLWLHADLSAEDMSAYLNLEERLEI